uniref:Putative secreted protein n=1 Tax=Anopheles triannulatus TaxID=58253 RepID=A0A2M4B7E4_9DIPT
MRRVNLSIFLRIRISRAAQCVRFCASSFKKMRSKFYITALLTPKARDTKVRMKGMWERVERDEMVGGIVSVRPVNNKSSYSCAEQ